MLLTDKQIKRFWSNIWIKTENECWFWRLGVNEKGYGFVGFNGKRYISSRIAYFLYYKIDPKELLVLHTCDNPRCCNPNHLFLGTHQDNNIDCKNKGRKPHGHNHFESRFTVEQIKEVRHLNMLGLSSRTVAKHFKVSHTTINNIISNISYQGI